MATRAPVGRARRAFEALPVGGRVYLHEALLSATRDGPPLVASLSLQMALVGLGKQYAADELEDMLQEVGFVDVTVQSTCGLTSLVRAIKPT